MKTKCLYDTPLKAYQHLKQVMLRRGTPIDHVVNILNKRGKLVYLTNGEVLYATFKPSFFYGFGKLFNKRTIGEYLNIETINVCILNRVSKILFLYPTAIYDVVPKLFKNYSEKHNYIKFSGNKIYYIPIYLLKRFK